MERFRKTGGLFFIAVMAALTVARLPDSLWLDEFSTAWITAGSFSECFDRSLRYQGQSPLYYLLVWGWRQLTSGSEVQLRLISFAAGLTGCVVVYFSFARIFGKWGSVLAAITMVTSIAVLRSLISARPYALVLLAALVSLHYVITALREECGKSLKSWALCFLFAALAAYLHYVFALFPVALAIVFLRQSFAVRLKSIVLSVLLLLILPACFPVFQLWLRRGEISGGLPPGYGEVMALAFPFFSVIGVVFLFGMCGGRWRSLVAAEDQPYLFAGLTIFLFPLAVLCGLSQFFSLTLFLPRYLLVSLPGFLLLIAVLGRQDLGRRILGGSAFLSLVWQALFAGPLRPPEDWRGAFNSIRGTGPTYVFSGFAELRSEEFVRSSGNQQYLMSPAEYYGVRLGEFQPYSCRSGAAALPKGEAIAQLKLIGRNSLELDGAMYDRCVKAMELEGFGLDRVEWFGGVFVAYFSRLNRDLGGGRL